MMADIQIFIDEQNKLDAAAIANTFTNKNVKHRAYINTLGAEIIKKYLNSENIDISDVKSIHSIKKVLEHIDISDIILKSLHIDVRVVFDENIIFIPKSHFEYDIKPDIYVVLHVTDDFVNAKLLGFFEPDLIDKNNANDEYYFVKKDEIASPHDFIEYVKSHANGLSSSISDDEFEASKEMFVSYIDNDINNSDTKVLLKCLVKSSELREELIEYENFEVLSSKAMRDSSIEKQEVIDTKPVEDEFEIFDTPEKEETSDDVLPLVNTEDVNSVVLEELQTEDMNVEVEQIDDTSEVLDSGLDIISDDDTKVEEQLDNIENIVSSEEEILTLNETTDEIIEDNLDVLPLEVDTDDVQNDSISEPIESVMQFEETENNNDENSEITDNIASDSVSFDNVNEYDSTVINDNIEDNTVSFDTLEKSIIDEAPEIYEEPQEQNEDSSFGKNLLDNLSAEENDNSYNAPETNYENTQSYDENDPDKLNVLYNEENSAETAIDDINNLDNLETLPEVEFMGENNEQVNANNTIKSFNKKHVIIAALLLVLAASAGFYLMKPKTNTQQAQTPNEVADTSSVDETQDNLSNENVLATNAPEVNETANIEVPNNKAVQEIKNNVTQQPKQTNVYMNVSKVVWDVPNELSQNTDIQNYLRTAGKSIKVSLSTDLLLATEYAYANSVKIGLTISQNGSLQSSQIISSSGSKQIDNIVLQCVKDTLNTVKPANGAVNNPNFNLGIIIYF